MLSQKKKEMRGGYFLFYVGKFDTVFDGERGQRD